MSYLSSWMGTVGDVLVQLTDTSTIRTNEPYRHPAIVAVAQKFFFTGKKPLGQRFRKTFSSSSKVDDAKEMPRAMLGLVSVAIYAALKEWSDGLDRKRNQDFASADFSEEYELHMTLLAKKILKTDQSGLAKYHTLMARLYREAASELGTSGANAGSEDSKLGEVDFDAMEE